MISINKLNCYLSVLLFISLLIAFLSYGCYKRIVGICARQYYTDSSVIPTVMIIISSISLVSLCLVNIRDRNARYFQVLKIDIPV